MIPIPTSGVLEEVRGIERVRSLNGITGVDIAIPGGTRVDPPPEGGRYLGFVFARGETPDLVETALRKAGSLLDPVIVSP